MTKVILPNKKLNIKSTNNTSDNDSHTYSEKQKNARVKEQQRCERHQKAS